MTASPECTAAPVHRRSAARDGAALLDAILFQVAVVLVGALLVMTTVAPNARRAARIEGKVRRLEARVAASARRVADLRREIIALQSDPLYIQRVLRRRTRELMPHRYQGRPLEALPGAVAAAPIEPPDAP